MALNSSLPLQSFSERRGEEENRWIGGAGRGGERERGERGERRRGERERNEDVTSKGEGERRHTSFVGGGLDDEFRRVNGTHPQSHLPLFIRQLLLRIYVFL